MAFCVGATVMLLRNYVVEENIMNGSIGVIEDIIYDDASGPHHQSQFLPSYVVVKFRNAMIPENMKAFANMPHTCVPIPVITEKCEKKCWYVCT